MEKMHEVLIERKYVCTLRDIFTMKGIIDHKLIRMSSEDDPERKPYESMAGRILGRQDAVVISQFSEAEIRKVIEESDTDRELGSFRSEQTKEGIRHYNIHYCSDDPICIGTIDYALPDSVDTSSSFSSDYQRIIQDAFLDNVAGITKWLYESQRQFLEFRAIENVYIGSGMVRNDIMIREMKTKDVVIILERDTGHDFLITTAYPDITERAETAVPTGRDISSYIHETSAYRYGTPAERYLLDQKITNGLTH